MSEDIEIKGRISIDTGDSASKIDGVKQAIKGASDEGGASTAMFSKLKGELSGLPGPAKQASEGIHGINGAFNVLKANPIIGVFVLIAGLVVGLFNHFKKMEGVSDSLGKAWAQLSGIFSWFMNNILEPLIDGFATLVGWITDAATFITGLFSPAAAAAAKSLGELEEKMDDLNDAEAKNNITRAESKQKLAEAREAAADANLPIAQRIKALQEAAKIEKETLNESIKINETRARYLLEKIAIELGARADLIEKIRSGSIEEVKIARDQIYELKTLDKEKIVAVDNSLITALEAGKQLAKVDKKTGEEITNQQDGENKKREAVVKEWEAKKKAAKDKADSENKTRLANLRAFEDKELKKQQEIQLGYMNDAQEKELTVLMNGYQAEIKANKMALDERKISKAQFHKLQIADLELFQQKEAAINKKYKEEADKKADADIKDKKKKDEDRKKEDAKIAAADLKATQKLALDKINFQLSQNTKDLNATKKLLKDKKAELTKQYAWEIANGKHTNAELLALQQQHVQNLAEVGAAEIEVEEKKKAAKLQAADAVAASLENIAELVGRHTVAGKAVAIAGATISTITAAVSAYENSLKIPYVGLVLAPINAALAVAMGLANIKKIASVQIPGKGGSGGGAAPSISVPAPVTPQRSGTRLDAQSIQGIGNAAAGGINRSFVLDADISNSQERKARIQRAARLG